MTEKLIENPILVLGGGGMLGSDLVKSFTQRWGKTMVVSPTKQELDITQPKEVEYFLKQRPFSFVVNAAAYTQVDRAETERQLSHQLNAYAPQVLTEIAGELSLPIVHFSTDYVFDGTATKPLEETDPPNPINYYGETKLLGEIAVLKNPQNLVLRVQWLYGEKRERFSLLRNQKTFTPFSDQFGAPAWTKDVAETVVKLMATQARGLFHFAYDDFASWYEVYALVCHELKLTTQLIPKKTKEVVLPAKRPLYGVMSHRKLLEQLRVNHIGSWQTSLKHFLVFLLK